MSAIFTSDNQAPIAPQIMAAILKANEGRAPSYGADDITARLQPLFTKVFETDLRIFPVTTGTAANALALAMLTPPWGTIFCHHESHIATDECGAPEFHTSGAKLHLLPGDHGRLTPEILSRCLRDNPPGDQHQTQPAVISLSQVTEAGTVYRPDEIVALTAIARRHKLYVHMDGARFANAVVSLNCSPADLSWRAGVDVLSFGATKNGALAAEAVVFFNPALSENFLFRRKRAGHLVSKMRFLSAQLEAYLENGLWLELASNANVQAARLADGLHAIPNVEILHPVQANEIFARIPPEMIKPLRDQGFGFHVWGREDEGIIRLVTAFDTKPGEADQFVRAVRALS
ncbi:MAG: low specificity L-threonine aldolase [Alphaproteobacteria bacterium]